MAKTDDVKVTQVAGGEVTVKFKKEKDTKNTVKFEEQPQPGKPPVIGSLYVQKWFAASAEELTVTIKSDK